MYPQTHFLFSYVVGLIFVKFGVFNYKVAFFVALVGLLIDVDHYLKFIFSKGKFGFRDAFNRMARGLFGGRSFIHHKWGFVVMTFLVMVLYFVDLSWFWIIGLGYYSHLFLDYVHLNFLKIREKITIKKFGFVEKINKFEILLDVFFLVAIALLLI